MRLILFIALTFSLHAAELTWKQLPGVGSNYVVFSTTDYELGLVTYPVPPKRSFWGAIARPATNATWTLIGTTTNKTFEVVVYKDEPLRFFDSYAAPIDEPIVEYPNFAPPPKTVTALRLPKTAGVKQGKRP